MDNNYGVSIQNLNGSTSWVTQEVPLVTGPQSDALKGWSFAEACAIANYLILVEGLRCKVGKPE